MAQAWFIRHGQSEANAGLPTRDRDSSPLTELGRKQARSMAGAFEVPPRLIVTSSFIRARQTAAPIIKRFPEVPVEIWPVGEFTYLAPAKYENSTQASRRPEVAAYWERLDPTWRDGRGAESFQDFMARVDETLKRVRKDKRFLAVVSHGQFMRGVMWRLINPGHGLGAADMARFRAWRDSFDMPNCSIMKLDLYPGRDPRFTSFLTNHLPRQKVSL